MKNALIVVDVQNDFCEGGSLEVKNANQIIPVINELIDFGGFDHYFFTKDWHPKNHGSFASQHSEHFAVYDKIQLDGLDQVLWPDHCIQNTKGSQFHPELLFGDNPIGQPPIESPTYEIVLKGMDPNVDSYSAFYDNGGRNKTELSLKLKSLKVETIYVVGLALDFCVKFTALDAVKEGFTTYVVVDATRAVGLTPISQTLNELWDGGVFPITAGI